MVDISEERNQPLALVNPEILEKHGEEQMEEGCLSVPGVYEPVQRAERVRVRALDRDGGPIDMEVDGLLAVCIQHEIDHLDGKLVCRLSVEPETPADSQKDRKRGTPVGR